MANELLLITGVTGHIGFRALRYALEYGYRVRAAVRSEAKAAAVRSNRILKAMNKDDQLSFTVIPDMTADGAFDEAVKGVDAIIHCASPVPSPTDKTDHAYEEFVKPAVDATLGVFRSAKKEKSVRRIVVTSSIVAIIPIHAAMMDTGEIFTPDTRQPDPGTSFEPDTMSFMAYGASKVSALNQAEKWMVENQPHFDAIHLMPSFVTGRNDMISDPAGLGASGSGFVLNIVTGTGEAVEGGLTAMPMTVNHIDDCARIHVEALDPKVAGGQSFCINYEPHQWDDAKAIVEKHFPEAVKSGVLPNKGAFAVVPAKIDSSKTEKTFGFKCNYEDCVVSIVGQYLELLGKGKA